MSKYFLSKPDFLAGLSPQSFNIAPLAPVSTPTLPAPGPVTHPSTSFRFELETPAGVRASLAVEGAPQWGWFLAGAGSAAGLLALLFWPSKTPRSPTPKKRARR
jgi:hypothetical protein